MPDTDMTRRILIALTAISFVLLAFASPRSAQERQVRTGTPNSDKLPGNKQIVNVADAEKFRGELIAAYVESEALIKFLAGYDFIRQSSVMEDYELACQSLETERARIEQMSVVELMAHPESLPESSALNRIVELSKSIRTDAKRQEVIQKAEFYSKAGLLSRNSLSAGKTPNVRNAPAAPAYIPPLCNLDDPSNYPSGADIAIPNGIALGLHTIADGLPEIIGFFVTIPFPLREILVIAAYAVDEVTSALRAVAADAAYCETLRFYVEDNLVNDDGFTALFISNDFYLTFLYRSVRSSLNKASNTTIPINCGNARLAEAALFFDGSDKFTGTGPQRVDVYSKLRTAYQNIGAAACVQ